MYNVCVAKMYNVCVAWSEIEIQISVTLYDTCDKGNVRLNCECYIDRHFNCGLNCRNTLDTSKDDQHVSTAFRTMMQ